MTQDLGPTARALLDAAREGAGPDAAAVRRMRAKIEAAAGAGAAGAAKGSRLGGLGGKLGVAAIALAIIAGVVLFGRRGDDAIAPRVELPAVKAEVAARGEVAMGREEGVGGAAGEGREGGAEIEVAPIAAGGSSGSSGSPGAAGAHGSPAPSRPSGRGGAAPAPAAPRRADLAREIVLIDQATDAMRRSDPSAALAAVRAHAMETAGAGQLAEEAAAIEIEALCKLREPSVGQKLAAFDARWPGSAQRSRLTARCP